MSTDTDVTTTGDARIIDQHQDDNDAAPTNVNTETDQHGVGEPTKDGTATGTPRPRNMSTMSAPGRPAALVALGIVVVLAALSAWLGLQVHHSHRAADQKALFLQVGRQGAVNLTTIDWQNADQDVNRILDSATGAFHDEFSQRSQPFIEMVKKVQSKSTGTITMAGLESSSDSEAQVLVAVTVTTSNAGAPQQSPRSWRMRISVQKVGDDAKMSKVEFVA